MKKQILVFPTWLIVRATTAFLPKMHPWKNRHFSLREWANGSTPMNDQCSAVFWVMGICAVLQIYFIYWRIHG